MFAYCSVGREVDTRRLLAHALRCGKRLALPQVRGGGEMVFRALTGALVTGRFYDIPEPAADAPEINPRPGDILVVPALCFDRDGYRLGQGAATMTAPWPLSGSVLRGLARAGLLQERLPRETHDRAVHCVVTEKGAARPQ